ncbi:MAG: hypothetical protein WDZ26_05550 [Nitriliruptoraceae bacterium]
MERSERTARWLVDEGLAFVASCADDLAAGSELSAATALRARGLTADRANLVVDVAAARLRARGRWPDADVLLFTREALEQASDPVVSSWRAHRLASAGAGPLWDLCAGVGGDALELARHGSVEAVDRDPVRAVLLTHNARVLARLVHARVADVRSVTVEPGARVHVDPGRRDGDRRLRRLAELVPPVDTLIERFGPDVTASGSLAIALPPAVALEDPVLTEHASVAQIEFLQVGATLVEAVLWLGAVVERPDVRATLLSRDAPPLVRTRAGEPASLAAGPVGGVLVDVAPAAVRARLHTQIGQEIDARRVDERRALLTCDAIPPPSPWYRRRHVEAVLPVRGRRVREWLRQADERPVEIVLHGVDGTDSSWWERFGRPARGPAGRRAEVVRTSTGAEVIMTVSIGDEPTQP